MLTIITFTFIFVFINALPLQNNVTNDKLSVKEMVII